MSDLPIPRIGGLLAGRFQLVEELGRGGFGAIFRARQRTPPHDLAVKILFAAKGRADDAELDQRFEREALMAEMLQHPHTVKQFEFGQTDEGLRFIAMELLRGETIAERIRAQGAFDTPLIIKCARAILQVLELAHRQDIVHRDLKPDNIMLCQVGDQRDFPKVLDFGAAKTTEGHHDITSAGMTLGSPAYMSPEVLMGKPPIPASDLYSLGLTLCETILAHKLVQGSDSLVRARIQLSPDPLPIPTALLQHPLYPWLARSIDKSLDRRYSSAAEMLRDLEQLATTLNDVDHATVPLSAIPPSDPFATEVLNAIDASATMELPNADSLTHPSPSLAPEDATMEMATQFADDDFASDPTEFIPQPFDPNQLPPTVPLSTVNAPPTSPSDDQSSDPAPVKSHAHFGAQRKPIAGEHGSRNSSKVILEPTFETDYQTIKTADKIKEGSFIRILIGGAVVLLIFVLLLYSMVPST